MKKIISVLLIITMLLGLCSCGRLLDAGVGISAVIRGNNSGKAKLTIKGEGLSELEKKADPPMDAGGGLLFKVTCKSDSGDKVVYHLEGLEAGSAIFIVELNGEDTTSRVCVNVSVDAKGKVSCSDLRVEDMPRFYESEDGTLISYVDGSRKEIRILAETGSWTIGAYDGGLYTVYPPDSLEDGHYSFEVEAKAAGEGSVQFVNRESKLQYVFNFTASEGDTGLILNIKDFGKSELTAENDTVEREKMDSLENNMRKAVPGIILPKDADVSDAKAYVKKQGEHSDPILINEENAQRDAALSKETVEVVADTASMTINYEGLEMDYKVTNEQSFKAACKSVEDLKATAREEEIVEGDITAKYYFTTYGYGVAIWESNGYTCILTILDPDQTDEKDVRAVKKFLAMD